MILVTSCNNKEIENILNIFLNDKNGIELVLSSDDFSTEECKKMKNHKEIFESLKSAKNLIDLKNIKKEYQYLNKNLILVIINCNHNEKENSIFRLLFYFTLDKTNWKLDWIAFNNPPNQYEDTSDG